MDLAPLPTTSQLLVALDVDGTIVHHDGSMAARVAEAIRALDAAGATVVIATGRSVVATLPVIHQLGLTTPGSFAVCSNGAITISIEPDQPDGYLVQDCVTFDPRPVVEVLLAEFPEAVIAVEEVGHGFKLTAPFPDGELQGRLRVVDRATLVADPATRVTVREPRASLEEFLDRVERLGLHGVNYAVGYSPWLDLAPEGVSKASALELVRRRLRIEPAATVAVGDQRNDLEMLHWAALGVAMGQAPAEVKAAADQSTGPVEEDGLAQLLEAIVAREEVTVG